MKPFVIPSIEKLSANYPAGTAGEVKELIGGNVNLAWLTNTCVVRISRAFNYSGQKIPKDFDGLETFDGADGLRYAFRVKEFEKFLRKRYGNPLISTEKGRFTPEIQDGLTRYKGVIMFEVDEWDDATGHFDIWNGIECGTNCYFDKATAIYLWVSPLDYNFEGVAGRVNKVFKD